MSRPRKYATDAERKRAFRRRRGIRARRFRLVGANVLRENSGNTLPKPPDSTASVAIWEGYLRAIGLGLGRGSVTLGGGRYITGGGIAEFLGDAIAERHPSEKDARPQAKPVRPRGASDDDDRRSFIEYEPSADGDFTKQARALARPNKKRRALTEQEIAWTMGTDIGRIRIVVAGKTDPAKKGEK